MVIARDALIQHRLAVRRARAQGVVIHHVTHGAKADLVKALHHGPELDDASGAVGVRGVGSLGNPVVDRVVPPVEGVVVGDGADRRLLLVGV